MSLAPGDPAMEIALARYGDFSYLDQNTIEEIRDTYKLDKPFWMQYGYWAIHAARLDFGLSMVEQKPVLDLILNRFSRTLWLSIAAVLVSLCLAFPLGVLSGIKKGSPTDYTAIAVSVLGVSIPNYWLGFVLIIVFGVYLHILPCFGYGTFQHIVLPALTLGTAITAYTTRVLRASTIDALNAEYIISFKAKGVSGRKILLRHVLKNTLVPVVTVIGLETGMILEGAVITETVFSWPGLGELLVNAIKNRDYPLIQGAVLFSTLVFVLINTIVDFLYAYLDPRIKLK
jgi:peptide/nickel transport system permease protein